jgi:hypothetical protein
MSKEPDLSAIVTNATCHGLAALSVALAHFIILLAILSG